jgi:hypothetical protein
LGDLGSIKKDILSNILTEAWKSKAGKKALEQMNPKGIATKITSRNIKARK